MGQRPGEFKRVLHGGLAGNVITYNAVVSVCENGQQAQQAPNVTTYNALISACEKGRAPAFASVHAQVTQGQSLESNVTPYSALKVPTRRARRRSCAKAQSPTSSPTIR